MRIVITTLLLIISFAGAHAQLSEDSLKNICISNYKQVILTDQRFSHDEYYETGLRTHLINNNLEITAQEVLKGYFDSLSIFTVTSQPITVKEKYIVDHVSGPYTRLYILNTLTGKQFSSKGRSAFNALMRSSKKNLRNLDKCYLYLLINSIEGMGSGVEPPGAYWRAIADGSAFAGDQFVLYGSVIYMYRYTQSNDEITQLYNLAHSSSNNCIYLNANKLVKDLDTVICYRFTFIKGDVETVSTVHLQ